MKQPKGQTNKIVISLLVLLLFCNCKPGTEKGDKNPVEDIKSSSLQLNPGDYIPALPRELSENSGLLIYDNLLWTFNDSGGHNMIYGFNSSGEIVKRVKIGNAGNRDWEDIAQDKDYIYIGDFGNNNGTRKDLVVYKIRKNEIGAGTAVEADAERIEFRFANQQDFHSLPHSSAFDCEALAERNGILYIFTKDWKHEATTVYQLPKEEGEHALQPVDSFQVKGLITGADFSPDKSKLALLGYSSFKPLVRLFSGISDENVFGNESTFIAMDSIAGAQTEGICFLNNDTLLVSCESTNQFPEQVFMIDLKNLK